MTVSEQDRLAQQISGESASGGPKRLAVDDDGKALLGAGTNVIGKVRLVSPDGDSIVDETLDSVQVVVKGKSGAWKTVTIAQSGTDSAEVDLGAEYRDVQVYSPAIDSATLTVKPCRNTGDAAVQANMLSGSAAGDFANVTTAKTAAGMNWFLLIGARYVKLILSAAQTSAGRTFYARGINSI